MKTIKASKARSDLDCLIAKTIESSEPVRIIGRRGNAVLVAEQDWRAIQETLHLLSIPGMRDSIREGLGTSIEECSRDLDP